MVLSKSSVARTDVDLTQEDEEEGDDIPNEQHMEEVEAEQGMPDLTSQEDVTESTGYDFTSISCGRNPVENTVSKRIKRRKNWS